MHNDNVLEGCIQLDQLWNLEMFLIVNTCAWMETNDIVVVQILVPLRPVNIFNGQTMRADMMSHFNNIV